MKWKPVDIVALIIAITICCCLLVAILMPVITGEPSTEKRSELLTNVFLSFVSIVSMYIGAKVTSNRKEKKEKENGIHRQSNS